MFASFLCRLLFVTSPSTKFRSNGAPHGPRWPHGTATASSSSAQVVLATLQMYGIIKMVDVFQFSNRYKVTEKLADFSPHCTDPAKKVTQQQVYASGLLVRPAAGVPCGADACQTRCGVRFWPPQSAPSARGSVEMSGTGTARDVAMPPNHAPPPPPPAHHPCPRGEALPQRGFERGRSQSLGQTKGLPPPPPLRAGNWSVRYCQ